MKNNPKFVFFLFVIIVLLSIIFKIKNIDNNYTNSNKICLSKVCIDKECIEVVGKNRLMSIEKIKTDDGYVYEFIYTNKSCE